jgi:hypothetical protein
MNIDLIIDELKVKYYKAIYKYTIKNGFELKWLNEYIDKLNETIDTETQKNINTCSSETNSIIYTDTPIYKKPWTKLNIIHKTLKIKEFVNELKMDNEQDRQTLKNELISLLKNKVLTKKEKVKYDEHHGKLISLIDLQYKDGKYIYNK